MKSVTTFLVLTFSYFVFASAVSLSAQSIEFTILPFNRVGNLMYIEAKADQQVGAFLIDTGFWGILLNKEYFHGMQTNRFLVGSNGKGPSIQEKLVDLSFGLLKAHEKLATIADISHLEKSVGMPLVGVIGSTFFEDYEVMIDYRHNQLLLVRLDESGEKTVTLPVTGPPTDSLSFKLKGHLPVIEAQINGRSLLLAIDSGAGSNLFRVKTLKDAGENISHLHDFRLRGLGHLSRKVQAGILSEMIVKDIPLRPMRTLFANISHINYGLAGPRLDGILGYEFLSQFKVAFNFKKKLLYLWHGEQAKQPPASEYFVKNRKD